MSEDLTARWLRRGFALCMAVIAAYLVVSAFEPFRTNWGDPWSDGNAMTAGRYFARDGFFATAFTPILDVGPLGPDSLRYTHYPPLPDLIAGVLQKVIGADHLPVHRLFAIGFSALGLLFLYRYLRALWGEGVAALSLLLIATNLLFLQYADTVHHIPLYSMTGFGCLWAALRWIDHRRPAALAAVAIATFFCFLASYDFYFFLSIMILATVRLRGAQLLRGPGRTLILVFGAAGVASIVVKNLLVIWAVGFDAWHADFVFQFFERATAKHLPGYKQMSPEVVFWRLWRFASPLFFAAIFAQLIGVFDRIRGRAPLMSLQPLVLLAAGVPFLLVFSQLVVQQYHPLLLLLPFAAVAIATLIVTAWRGSRTVAAALVLTYLGWQAWNFSLFKKTFLAPADVAAVSRALEPDRHQMLLSNIFPDGPVRFLWDRHLVGITPDPVSLRDNFEIYGADSPLTIAQVRPLRAHLYDKGVYVYFRGDRRDDWIARPDYYRNAWGRVLDAEDAAMNKGLDGIGRVTHESREMIVRSVTIADLDAHQQARVPANAPTVIDFGTESSEPYKLRGISPHVAETSSARGFSWLYAREPARIVFTLQGYIFRPTGPAIRTSSLLLRLPAGRAVRLSLEVSTPAPIQTLTVSLEGRALAQKALTSDESLVPVRGAPKIRVERLELEIPPSAVSGGGPHRLDLEFSSAAMPNAVRLHRLELREVCGDPTAPSPLPPPPSHGP